MRITSDAGRIGPFTWINSIMHCPQIPRVRIQIWGGFAWGGLPHVECEFI